MRLYGMQAESKEERNAFFVEAGQAALEAAAQGHPAVYRWVVDYLRRGYDAEEIYDGIEMLNSRDVSAGGLR